MFTLVLSFVLLTGEIVPYANRTDRFATLAACEKVKADDEVAFARDFAEIKRANPQVAAVKLDCVKS